MSSDAAEAGAVGWAGVLGVAGTVALVGALLAAAAIGAIFNVRAKRRRMANGEGGARRADRDRTRHHEMEEWSSQAPPSLPPSWTAEHEGSADDDCEGGRQRGGSDGSDHSDSSGETADSEQSRVWSSDDGRGGHDYEASSSSSGSPDVGDALEGGQQRGQDADGLGGGWQAASFPVAVAPQYYYVAGVLVPLPPSGPPTAGAGAGAHAYAHARPPTHAHDRRKRIADDSQRERPRPRRSSSEMAALHSLVHDSTMNGEFTWIAQDGEDGKPCMHVTRGGTIE